MAEKTQDKEGTDAVEEGTKKHVHRFAKSAIMQASGLRDAGSIAAGGRTCVDGNMTR